MTATLDRPKMAKRTNDVSTKIDAEALRLARLAAETMGISTAEYLSRIAKEHATKTLDAWAEARVKGAVKPKPKP